MNGRFKSTSSEKFGSAGPTMAMEVPAPPQGVIGSVCGWLYGVFGPGNIKQDHIRNRAQGAGQAVAQKGPSGRGDGEEPLATSGDGRIGVGGLRLGPRISLCVRWGLGARRYNE